MWIVTICTVKNWKIRCFSRVQFFNVLLKCTSRRYIDIDIYKHTGLWQHVLIIHADLFTLMMCYWIVFDSLYCNTSRGMWRAIQRRPRGMHECGPRRRSHRNTGSTTTRRVSVQEYRRLQRGKSVTCQVHQLPLILCDLYPSCHEKQKIRPFLPGVGCKVSREPGV